MRYTIHLFALRGDEFAARLRDAAAGLLSATRERIETEGNFEPDDIDLGLRLAEEICRGQLPNECEMDYFWALIWLCDTALERVPYGQLEGVRSWSYVKATGVWPLLSAQTPPFPVPHSRETPPGVGYVANSRLTTELLPALEEPPPASDDDEEVLEFAEYARQQLSELAESIAADGLDLLAVLTVN
ncbi:MAG: hypothetical protein ACK5Q5_00960 [Planctomycetaceae bacterium]